MMYKLLHHDRYARETSIFDFKLLTEVCEFLYGRVDDLDDFELFKVVDDKFNLHTMVETYDTQRSELRTRALAKLNDEEKAILGLTNG